MRIVYIDRKTKEEKVEIVAGDKAIMWSYDTAIGKGLLELIIKKRFFSSLFGGFMDTSYSKRRIQSFIDQLGINIDEAQREGIAEYKSFNDFFARSLKPDARPINTDRDAFVSPADGKILAYENIDIHRLIQVKGFEYSLAELIGNKELAEEYDGGTCIVVRLAPADYHRFHFPDGGIPSKSNLIQGSYYSVNPYALNKIAKLYCQNKRELTVFESNHFSKILLIEVGATGVGGIIQTFKANTPVEKGQEKGYFKFGGSTTILFLKRNMIKIDEDILQNTRNGFETKVYMGESIAYRIKENE